MSLPTWPSPRNPTITRRRSAARSGNTTQRPSPTSLGRSPRSRRTAHRRRRPTTGVSRSRSPRASARQASPGLRAGVRRRGRREESGRRAGRAARSPTRPRAGCGTSDAGTDDTGCEPTPVRTTPRRRRAVGVVRLGRPWEDYVKTDSDVEADAFFASFDAEHAAAPAEDAAAAPRTQQRSRRRDGRGLGSDPDRTPATSPSPDLGPT